jgi:hypothetical protein
LAFFVFADFCFPQTQNHHLVTIMSNLCTPFHSGISFSNWKISECVGETPNFHIALSFWHLQHPYSLIHEIYAYSNMLFFQLDVLIKELICSMLGGLWDR